MLKQSLIKLLRQSGSNFHHFKSISTNQGLTGTVVGVRQVDGKLQLTDAAGDLDEKSGGKLSKFLQCGSALKAGKSRVLYGVCPNDSVVCAVGLGEDPSLEGEATELRHEGREAVRTAAAAGYSALCGIGVDTVAVDACGDAEAAAEGAHLASFLYQDMKTTKKPRPTVASLAEPCEDWLRGSAMAGGQNLARRLMETPANILTPTQFAQEAVTALEPLGVEVLVRSYEWAKNRSMGAFLSVTRGSQEPPVFLELIYRGSRDRERHLALVGKGVTFDTGGISLKPPKGMEAMRADMGGAACTLGALYGIAAMKLPLFVRGYIPLCENMPGGAATKPGDVVTASNGKTIQVDNTDAEGRLILADALHYASQAKPLAMLDMATLTGAMSVALGSVMSGTFSNSDPLWEGLRTAAHTSGDRLWRMPLLKEYDNQVTDCGYADVHNLGKMPGQGGACTAAAFLKQFVTCSHWAHIDIAGVMQDSSGIGSLGKGMSGRPTRTVVHFARLLAEGKINLS